MFALVRGRPRRITRVRPHLVVQVKSDHLGPLTGTQKSSLGLYLGPFGWDKIKSLYVIKWLADELWSSSGIRGLTRCPNVALSVLDGSWSQWTSCDHLLGVQSRLLWDRIEDEPVWV